MYTLDYIQKFHNSTVLPMQVARHTELSDIKAAMCVAFEEINNSLYEEDTSNCNCAQAEYEELMEELQDNKTYSIV